MSDHDCAAVLDTVRAVVRICDHQPQCGLTAWDDCPACVPHDCDTHGGDEAFACPELKGTIVRCVDANVRGDSLPPRKETNG